MRFTFFVLKRTFFLILLFTFFRYNAESGAPRISDNNVSLIFPLPGSEFVSLETNIIFRYRQAQNIQGSSSSSSLRLIVKGSKSGLHTLRSAFSDDNRIIIYQPDMLFASSEIVTVQVTGGADNHSGKEPGTETFSFSTRDENPSIARDVVISDDLAERFNAQPQSETSGLINKSKNAESLPADYPSITVNTFSGNIPQAELFVSNTTFGQNSSNVPYLTTLTTEGVPIFYRKMTANALDYKRQPNGMVTYFDQARGYFVALDSFYTEVDQFKCGNGYSTDVHELRILPNGHALLLSYDPEPVRMDTIVSGGDPNALVTGLIIQELDAQKNVVFQWRSWDHFKITDAVGVNLTAANIDYVHGNALEIEENGDILLSSRHMDEITKIDRETGNILWRWGGKNNQFTFTGDTLPFSHQHAVRRLPNGHITLFDNGNLHSPQFSRAVEYVLDEKNKTATLTWQYRHTPDIYGGSQGYVQRLEDGSTLIDWGGVSNPPNITYVAPDSTKIFEVSYLPGVVTYRAYMYTYPAPYRPSAEVFPAAGLYSLTPNLTAQESIKVTNSGYFPLVYHASAHQPWLTVDTSQGYVHGIASSYLHFVINGSVLSQWSTYLDTIMITSNDTANALIPVPITLTTLGPKILVMPAIDTIEVNYGNVVDDTIWIHNKGTMSLTFTMTNSDTSSISWLLIGDSTGIIGAGDSVRVRIAIDATNLLPGKFAGVLQLSSNDSLTGNITIPLTLNVTNRITVSTAVDSNWNIVSLPVAPQDNLRPHLYPSSASPAFAYTGVYVARDFLTQGIGYWLKFNSKQFIQTYGFPKLDDSIEVNAGWNIIGSLSSPLSVDGVTSSPAGIMASSFFKYSNGYFVADTIQPGRGYWIKTNNAGRIVMHAESKNFPKHSLPALSDGFNSITFTDAGKRTQTLYFGVPRTAGHNIYEMPPLPPEGIFDARYKSGTFLEEYHSAGSETFPILLNYARSPVTVEWNINARDRNRYKILDGLENPRLLSGRGSIVLNFPAAESATLHLVAESEKIPQSFVLRQNYPNPFNPWTKILFELPQDVPVTLKVYNMLGQEVRTLVDEQQEAGYKSVQFDAADLPSGVYTYRLTAGTFVDVKKMLLIK